MNQLFSILLCVRNMGKDVKISVNNTNKKKVGITPPF